MSNPIYLTRAQTTNCGAATETDLISATSAGVDLTGYDAIDCIVNNAGSNAIQTVKVYRAAYTGGTPVAEAATFAVSNGAMASFTIRGFQGGNVRVTATSSAGTNGVVCQLAARKTASPGAYQFNVNGANVSDAVATFDQVKAALAAATTAVDFNGQKITTVGNATASGDAANLGVVNTQIDAATADNATATMVAIIETRHVHYEAPAAADLVSIVNAVDAADGAQVIAAQPAFPCKLQVRIVDANSSISAGTIDLVAVGARGQAVTQSIPLTGGTQTVTTTDAIATLTSATIVGLAGAAPGDTIGIGVSGALGLPGPKALTPSAFAVFKANVDNANEAVGTVDATAGTIVPTTAPNGTHTYDFWYNFTYTPVQNAHGHGVTHN